MIELKSVGKTYDHDCQPVEVLKDLFLTVGRHDHISIMGASGSGKSTLVNIIGLLDEATCGEHWFDGCLVSELTPRQRARLRCRSIGYVFQNFCLLPHLTALENVMMPAVYGDGWDDQTLQRAKRLLAAVECEHVAQHRPSQLSGGQQQRVAIARSLIGRPKLLLADEPTGSLDQRTSQLIIELLLSQCSACAFLLITHNPDIAASCRRRLVMEDGRLLEC